MPLHQTTGFVESLLRLAGLDWAVPDFSTLSRRQKTLNVSLPYRGGSGPLNLLIDSIGIKSEGEDEWNARKHGGSKRRVWRKMHMGIDEETLEVRAVEVTTSNIGEAPMLPELLGQISPDQDVGSVTADGAYDTRKCHDAIATRGAHAVIPPRKNAKPWKPTSPGAIARNDAVNETLPRSHYLETLERIPPPKPRREQDALCETTGPIPDGSRLRPAGCGNPNPCRRPQSLHRSRHTRYTGCRISPSGGRGTAFNSRFVQQSHAVAS